MKHIVFIFFFTALTLFGCEDRENEPEPLQVVEASIGEFTLSLAEPITEGLPVDRTLSLRFSTPLAAGYPSDAVRFTQDGQAVNHVQNLSSDARELRLSPIGVLEHNTLYTVAISPQLTAVNGAAAQAFELRFKTIIGGLQLVSATWNEANSTHPSNVLDVPTDLQLRFAFNVPVSRESLRSHLRLTGPSAPGLNFEFHNDDREVHISTNAPMQYLRRYQLTLADALKGASGESFGGRSWTFFTLVDESPKFPIISDEELLEKVQSQTFKYFWDFAHPQSGMTRERNTSGNLVTLGGSGFGVMAVLVGIERGWISRSQGIARLRQVVDFLESADRFHGVWPHWLNGNTGQTIPFSTRDNGADLVETALMIQGLLTVRAYLNPGLPEEQAIATKITQMWREVEWDWFRQNGQNVLYWHWSPDFGWQMNLRIQGWNESLIIYVLAAASPTHPVPAAVYHQGWTRNGQMRNGNTYYGYPLPLGSNLGGPLFFAHYSFLGLDPRQLSDEYAEYWTQNRHHTLINRAYCIQNPLGFAGYHDRSWGLTASDGNTGYSAHSPTNDRGVITPTAALSSFPYTPEASMEALKFFYYQLGDRIWGEYGFYDAFNVTEDWYARSYLAIDQGPIILMIENHRSALLWELFMKDTEVRAGLDKLGFSY